MSKIQNYLQKYGSKTFLEVPFNDIDSLLFTLIIYADFEGIVPSEKAKNISFSEALQLCFNRYKEEGKSWPLFFREVYDLLETLIPLVRYQDVQLSHYVKMVDDEKQFCAVTFRFHKLVYIAYEGTDTSIVGWKEDFLLTSSFPVPAQKLARDYLKDEVGLLDFGVYVGGHSKGGNLAMAAYMLSNPLVRFRIQKVYNFDGPGFRKKEFCSKMYRKMEKKLSMVVPEDSTFGLLLHHTNHYAVVKSNGLGLWQHNPLTWECADIYFAYGELTARSQKLETSNVAFLEKLGDAECNQIIDILFQIVGRLGITDTSHIPLPSLKQIMRILKEVTHLDAKVRKDILDFIKIILKGA